MKIVVDSIFVPNQDEALKFYTEVLGFKKKSDFPVGKYKWLTVISPEQPDGPELLLEPDDHPAAKAFKKALVQDGIPVRAFGVTNVQEEYERLTGLGVKFTMKPQKMGPVTMAVFDDTCGNLIQIAQKDA
jgi:catechol 2,3-dioxygenase-like lactoylglutathione lyase family enzyme